MLKPWQGAPPKTTSTAESPMSDSLRIYAASISATLRQMAAHSGKLNSCVAQWMGSYSTAAATSNPACSKPRLIPPAPANRSTPIGLLPFAFIQRTSWRTSWLSSDSMANRIADQMERHPISSPPFTLSTCPALLKPVSIRQPSPCRSDMLRTECVLLILASIVYSGNGGDGEIKINTKININIEINTKIKGGGQECPPYITPKL